MAKIIVAPIIFALQFLVYIASAQELDITKYGAKAGGDITQALLDAWKEACAASSASKIVIPTGTWQLGQVELVGPNKAPIELNVQGTLTAPGSFPNEKDWITINKVDNLEISGGGVFDGKGQEAWKKNDCKSNANCGALPISLSLYFITNGFIHDVTSKDSKYFHINCISSKNVTFSKLTISAPADSPNTDGIHVARSSDITITDTTIETGDDCISIGDESSEYHITNVACGPGHGISIGSLGKYEGEKDVKGIYVEKCTFKGTENGIRVKTWPSSSIKLLVSELHFKDLTMDNVDQPIIIDQEYCPNGQCDLGSPSQVSISNVFIDNVHGTSSAENAVIFACSKSNPCQNVNVGNIELKSSGSMALVSKCENVKPVVTGTHTLDICSA